MRNKLVVFSVGAVLLLLSLGGSTYAHHGITAFFDASRSVTMKGNVTSFEWTNPHSYIYFEVKDGKGAVEKWTGELGSVGMLSRSGWRRDTFKPGDAITAIGNPAKDGKSMMIVDKVVLASGQELLGRNPVPVEGVTPPKE